jgi:hypothetical protein
VSDRFNSPVFVWSPFDTSEWWIFEVRPVPFFSASPCVGDCVLRSEALCCVLVLQIFVVIAGVRAIAYFFLEISCL